MAARRPSSAPHSRGDGASGAPTTAPAQLAALEAATHLALADCAAAAAAGDGVAALDRAHEAGRREREAGAARAAAGVRDDAPGLAGFTGGDLSLAVSLALASACVVAGAPGDAVRVYTALLQAGAPGGAPPWRVRVCLADLLLAGAAGAEASGDVSSGGGTVGGEGEGGGRAGLAGALKQYRMALDQVRGA